ncbi:MAG: hypothetical protein COA53_10165 [Rhodobacteraceae bacterium]|nr:MAG: hypothetical protein COA53_10165 [Paracoccaceae bacterium]
MLKTLVHVTNVCLHWGSLMICIVICTRERPIMLRRVLESCAKITTGMRSELQFLIIENGPEKGAREVVSGVEPQLNILYFNEPNLGIVNARNAGIDAFLDTDADWMATIDDDEIISDGWLTSMLDAIDAYPQCNVFSGPQIRVLPENISQWLISKPKPNPETGTPVWNASTANALFNRAVFAPDKMGLRFHPLFNLSGGSDTHLFFQLKDLGEDVLWVRDAECFEPMVIERTHFRVRVKRTIQSAQSWGKSIILRSGKLRGGTVILRYALICSVNFISFGICGGIVRIFSAKFGNAILNKSLTFGCHAVGYFKAILRPQGELYANIDGE